MLPLLFACFSSAPTTAPTTSAAPPTQVADLANTVWQANHMTLTFDKPSHTVITWENSKGAPIDGKVKQNKDGTVEIALNAPDDNTLNLSFEMAPLKGCTWELVRRQTKRGPKTEPKMVFRRITPPCVD